LFIELASSEEGRKKTLVSAVRLRRERADHVIKEEIARKAVLASKQAARFEFFLIVY
jgi:hypothetical protein